MIQLRQQIEEVLNDKNLGKLHLERNTSGSLVLAGDCGKPIVTIKGIVVPTKITSKEREYIAELVIRFINDYAPKIHNALDFLISAKDPLDRVVNGKYRIMYTRGYGTIKHSNYTYWDAPKSIFSLHTNTEHMRVDINLSTKGASAEELAKYLKNYSMFEKEFLDFVKEHQAYLAKLEEINELASCVI